MNKAASMNAVFFIFGSKVTILLFYSKRRLQSILETIRYIECNYYSGDSICEFGQGWYQPNDERGELEWLNRYYPSGAIINPMMEAKKE